MDREVQEIRLQQWAKLVQDACNCGKTKKEWCAEHGLTEKQLYYWQRKVRQRSLEKHPGEIQMVQPAFATLAPPVKETSYIEALSPEEPGSRGDVSSPDIVLCTDDYRILIGSSVSEPVLTSVLRAIRNA